MNIETVIEQIHLDALKLKEVLIVFTIFIGVDVLTGIINAVLKKELSSTKMKQGLYGKLGEMIIITMVIVLNRFLGLPYIVAVFTVIFYISQEGLSILENTAEYISYPQFIKDFLIKINELSSNKKEVKGDK